MTRIVPTIRGGLATLIGAQGVGSGALEGRTITGAGDILLLGLLVCCFESVSPRTVSIFRDPLNRPYGSVPPSTGDEAGTVPTLPCSVHTLCCTYLPITLLTLVCTYTVLYLPTLPCSVHTLCCTYLPITLLTLVCTYTLLYLPTYHLTYLGLYIHCAVPTLPCSVHTLCCTYLPITLLTLVCTYTVLYLPYLALYIHCAVPRVRFVTCPSARGALPAKIR
jgi:hypothetical protein